VSTYRLWLLHELFKGALSPVQYEESEQKLSGFINARINEKPLWARLKSEELAVSETIALFVATN
jgi:hypothetical protein